MSSPAAGARPASTLLADIKKASETRSPVRHISSFRFRRTRMGSSSEGEKTDEMVRLEKVLESDKGRQYVVRELIGAYGDLSNMARFCVAVTELKRLKQPQDRSAKMDKILSLYIEEHAMFRLPIVEPEVELNLIKKDSPAYDAMRHKLLEELSLNPKVMTVVREVETGAAA